MLMFARRPTGEIEMRFRDGRHLDSDPPESCNIGFREFWSGCCSVNDNGGFSEIYNISARLVSLNL